MQRGVGVVNEFKTFLLRGNVVDLAVGIVIGAAFGAVVTSLTENLISPLLAVIGGQPDFGAYTFTINNAIFSYGQFITDIITFLITAAVIFFFVVKPINALIARSRREPPADPSTMSCPECLSEIPIAARRCAFCGVPIEAASTGISTVIT